MEITLKTDLTSKEETILSPQLENKRNLAFFGFYKEDSQDSDEIGPVSRRHTVSKSPYLSHYLPADFLSNKYAPDNDHT
jgi:hypothetical protein